MEFNKRMSPSAGTFTMARHAVGLADTSGTIRKVTFRGITAEGEAIRAAIDAKRAAEAEAEENKRKEALKEQEIKKKVAEEAKKAAEKKAEEEKKAKLAAIAASKRIIGAYNGSCGPLFDPRKVTAEKDRDPKIVWVPQPRKFLLAYCYEGDVSIRVRLLLLPYPSPSAFRVFLCFFFFPCLRPLLPVPSCASTLSLLVSPSASGTCCWLATERGNIKSIRSSISTSLFLFCSLLVSSVLVCSLLFSLPCVMPHHAHDAPCRPPCPIIPHPCLQINTRLVCFRNTVILAAALNRTVIVPMKKSEQYVKDYDLRMVFHLETILDCYGPDSVISSQDYQERYGKSVEIDRLHCWHGPYASCLVIPDAEDKGCPATIDVAYALDPKLPHDKTKLGVPTKELKVTVDSLLAKFFGGKGKPAQGACLAGEPTTVERAREVFGGITDSVLAVGDMRGHPLAFRKLIYPTVQDVLQGSEECRAHAIGGAVGPHPGFFSRSHEVRQILVKDKKYIALHWPWYVRHYSTLDTVVQSYKQKK